MFLISIFIKSLEYLILRLLQFCSNIIYNYWRFLLCGLGIEICIFKYYTTIDIHKAIGKLPIIPKRGFTLSNMNYCGPYNPLNK